MNPPSPHQRIVHGRSMLMRRFALATVLALAASFTLAAQTPAPALSKEMKALQGTWVITVANGQNVEGQAPEVRMEITGNNYAQIVNGQVVERGTMKIDGSKTPMTIDMQISEGQDANKAQVGV